MNIFDFRSNLIADYASFTQGFLTIKDERIKKFVQSQIDQQVLWPEPLVQLNPSFAEGESVERLVSKGILHPICDQIFRIKSEKNPRGTTLKLHRHQEEAIFIAKKKLPYVVTTGTGSGKSLCYIIPIVDYVLNSPTKKTIKAIVVYPMNALANSQLNELNKFLTIGFPNGKSPITYARYTGQENEEDRKKIIENPPDILLTNYVMLELILTRPKDAALVRAAQGLQFLVFDEMHTYRGRQGADVALLIRRVREATHSHSVQCVGTSATLSTEGKHQERQQLIAEVASQLFGTNVLPENVISETLKRITRIFPTDDASLGAALRSYLEQNNFSQPISFEELQTNPFYSWIETKFGITVDEEQRLVRAKPITIQEAASQLSQQTGLAIETCQDSIQKGLLAGYQTRNPITNRPALAFRLHQFISRGDTVYTNLKMEKEREFTINRQQFVPGSDKTEIWLPLVFCRECGQEYFCVRKREDDQGSYLEYRDLNDRDPDNSELGFLYLNTEDPWKDESIDFLRKRLPEDWIEEHPRLGERIKKTYQKFLPRPMWVHLNGKISNPAEKEGAIQVHFIPAPFRFCLCCGVTYNARQTSDFGKLSALGMEGRSTAISVLSLSVMKQLRKSDLPHETQKLLSFTDNRQDASLQAGHFNDFVEIGIIRGALYSAVQKAGTAGIRHDVLTQKVFDALNLPFEAFASNPEARFQGKIDIERAFRNVLGYRLYRDLRRGWRITSPNLEQCGLLEIQYPALEELSQADDVWQNAHPLLAQASPEKRAYVAKVLLDYMRRELAIKVDYLEPKFQDAIIQQSNQRLIEPWAIDENEAGTLDCSTVVFPCSRWENSSRNVFISGRGGFGIFLNRELREQSAISISDREQIIADLLKVLKLGGIVEEVILPYSPKAQTAKPPIGYQVVADSLLWVLGEGTKAFHDPIRVPRSSAMGGRTNPFFIDFYRNAASTLHKLYAKEHTAQVPYEERIKREKDFRNATLPILYCSPTMELGIDISDLNIVNLRNVPPTPANYAQRSGRAGRSGQPAMVISYCSTGSSHDQWFFRRPHLMVTGAVNPPQIDLANEDLIRAHVQAIWLSETGLDLKKSLGELLELKLGNPELALPPSVRIALNNSDVTTRAKQKAERVLADIIPKCKAAGWYGEMWLDNVLKQASLKFDEACNRWRGLYRAACKQQEKQNEIVLDQARDQRDKEQAARLRREAEQQLRLLTESDDVAQNDFYSYRYFASEGFLPGYNFPRLPLSAFIPARKTKQREEYLSRPRFLAISEFGPRAIVYHEGSRYEINQVILAIEEDEITTTKAKRCDFCGYLHPLMADEKFDTCQKCNLPLSRVFDNLLRLQNVSTRRKDRINCDEEERQKLGYEIQTAIRFAEKDGKLIRQVSHLVEGGQTMARLVYGRAATLWRINLGWRRRSPDSPLGFILDEERGYWKKENSDDDNDNDDPMSNRLKRVIPYVEDHRNCLLFEIEESLSLEQFLSLESALKMAIQLCYQLEENELATELLPDSRSPKSILLYEAAEGGAGVLRQLLEVPYAFANVAKRALEICHFDPHTGENRKRASRATEDCEAACYDCLMHYGNQRIHRYLDRHQIKDFLLRLTRCQGEFSSMGDSRSSHLDQLMRLCDSQLEKNWLEFLEMNKCRLPDEAQKLIESCQTRCDFFYQDHNAVIYVDGPVHDYPERHQRDVEKTEALEDHGFLVVRFHHSENWMTIVERYPQLFGRKSG